ncbi:hypothetical protein HN014_07370 [Aquimarina sp. TRL1]|nr:hypothetical protein [Aquimarina sp. TRL1]QKX04738.1 hypothetical protein HN014_07370 [Aquimarina sp. TRL1]
MAINQRKIKMGSGPKYKPIAPDAVSVWSGFKTKEKTYDEFVDFLGSIIVPVCSFLRPKIGLNAYIPSLPNPENKPKAIPDQTALLFWESKNISKEKSNTVVERLFTLLFDQTYSKKNSSMRAVKQYKGIVKANQPYYLVDEESDWMHGTVYHKVGYKHEGQSEEAFLASIKTWADAYTSERSDGAILMVADNYVVFWEHFPRRGMKASSSFNELGDYVTLFLDKTAKSIVPPKEGVWGEWKGIDLIRDNCVNIHLERV